MNPIVSIIMGSTSDMPVLEKAAKLLDEFEIPFEINALSAHRTPQEVTDFANNASKRGRRAHRRAFCGIQAGSCQENRESQRRPCPHFV